MPKQHLQKPRTQPVQQQKIHPCSELGNGTKQPLILYCGASVKAYSSGLLGQAAQKSLYFEGHVHFARWLFSQRRGAVNPWAILVASWREAKPCAMAIAAARTGCCDGLRVDSRRRQLRKCSGTLDLGQLANVAVSGMIIILADGECTPKVTTWIHKTAIMTELPFRAVRHAGLDLGNVISSMAPGYREFHKKEHEQQLIQGKEHLVKPTDPVESAAALPDKEEHKQLSYILLSQMRPLQIGDVGHLCRKAMPTPMYIELNPWFHDSSVICA
jgi:hypothetical protein